MRPRTPLRCDGSKEARLTGGVIGQCLLHQSVQFAGSCVTVDLTIPVRAILFHQPLAQLREFIRVEFDDLLFELLDASHDISSLRRPDFRPANGATIIRSEVVQQRRVNPLGMLPRGQVLRPAILATTNARPRRAS
jgi:hypothetical protein